MRKNKSILALLLVMTTLLGGCHLFQTGNGSYTPKTNKELYVYQSNVYSFWVETANTAWESNIISDEVYANNIYPLTQSGNQWLDQLERMMKTSEEGGFVNPQDMELVANAVLGFAKKLEESIISAQEDKYKELQ